MLRRTEAGALGGSCELSTASFDALGGGGKIRNDKIVTIDEKVLGDSTKAESEDGAPG